MAMAPSVRSLMNGPSRATNLAAQNYRDSEALPAYGGFQMRSNQAHDDYARGLGERNLAALSAGENDPFYAMKLDQNAQAKVSPWSPFYQAMSEATGGEGELPHMRFDGYNPKRDAAATAVNAAQSLRTMPFRATSASYPMSVRQLFGE